MKTHNRRTKQLCSHILMIWAILCSLIVCTYLDTKSADAATTQTGCITYGSAGVYFRKTPGGEQIKHNGTVILLNGGHALTILDTSNESWYKVRLTYSGTTYTGYVASQYVFFSSSSATSDAEFEAMIADFPESYKPQLRELHKQHPKWIFNPVQTGLDWSTVVANEKNTSAHVKNLVQGTSSYPRYNWRSTTVGYNYVTDTYKSYDGSCWYAASDALVTYYLDPRIYLSERYIFAFESLAYDAAQTSAGVEAILNGSFMYKTKPTGYDSNYSTLMVKAGAATGISPYHIASRIRQEVGSTSGPVTNGKHSKYPGIYNFYNIGAYDSATGDAPTLALKWASQKNASYNRPWNTVYKSIYGGALFLGEKYIFKGQNTLYTQKFNVTNKTDGLFSHQYMTNVQAVSSEASKVYTAYSDAKMLDNPIVFLIPVYNNMPTAISSMPSDSGSPNNYLKTLTVSGYNLNFSPTTTSYNLSVKANVSSITIGATTMHSKATVSGTGKIALKTGTNKINIIVTAQSGTKKTYTLTVKRDSVNNPAATKNLQTTPGKNAVTLSWDKVSGATGYLVYKYNTSSNTWERIAKVTGTSYTDTGLPAGAAYKYAVRTYRVLNGTTYLSDTFPTKKGMAKLNNVSGISATSKESSITLSWDTVSRATGYRVYRYNTSKQAWERIADTTETSYTDSGRSIGKTYKYTVRAYRVLDGTTYLSPSYTEFRASTAPAVVNNLQTTPGKNAVTLSWDPVTRAGGYRIYRYDTTKRAWVKVATVNETSYTDTDLSAGVTYQYTVRAFRKVDGNVYWGKTAPAKDGMANLNNVTNVNMTSKATSIELSWSKVAHAKGYYVYRYNTSKKAWERIGTTTETSYTDSGLKSGRTYQYTVRAYKPLNETVYLSPYFYTFKTSTNPASVSFQVTAGSGQATVTWNKVPGATSYRVYYKASSNESWKELTTTTETSYTLTGLTKGQTYYFTVRALRSYNGNTYMSTVSSQSVTVK